MNRRPDRAFTGMMRCAACAVLLCLGGVLAAAEPTTPAADPLEAARASLAAVGESWRHAVQPALWPEAAPPMPDQLEVVLLTGYIDLSCLRVTWRSGAVEAAVAQVGRTWFYNGAGETETPLRRIDLDPQRFASAWRAMLALDLVRPAPADEPAADDTTDDGEPIRRTARRSGINHSHAPDSLVEWRTPGGAWQRRFDARGTGLVDDLLPLADARVEAQARLLIGLLPDRRGVGGSPDADAAAAWRGFLIQAAEGLEPEPSGRLGTRTALVAGFICRLAAQIGDRESLPAVARAVDAVPAGTYVGDNLRREAAFARERIALRSAWDPAAAARIIADNPRQFHAENDQAHWVRGHWRATDAAGYRAWLHGLLASGTPVELLAETIGELAGDGDLPPALAVLCGHEDPRIAVLAAQAILGVRRPGGLAGDGIYGVGDAPAPLPGHPDAGMQEAAIAALERLAGDAEANGERLPVWPAIAARSEAVAAARALPGGRAWDDARLRRLQEDPACDGRLMTRLLVWRGRITPTDPVANRPTAAVIPEEVEAWRRVLARGLRDRGVFTAGERLAVLGDDLSMPAVQALRDEAAARFAVGDRFDVLSRRLPWLRRDMLWPLERALERRQGPAGR